MDWFYAEGGRQVGPVPQSEFDRLVQAGTIQGDTLVWREGMPDWRTYREVAGASAPVAFAGGAGAALDLRPMSIGDILDRTFRLYRSHFMPFFLVMLVVQATAYVLGLAWQLSFYSELRSLEQGPGAVGAAFFGSFALLLPIAFITFVLNQIGLGTLTAAVSAAFLQQEVSMRQAFGAVRSKLGRLLGATMLNSLIIWVGLMLCIIPGIYFALWYLLVGQVVVLENLGPTAALRRSKELMRVKTDRGFAKHNYTKAGVILLITFALGAVVGGLIAVPFAILQAMSGPRHTPGPFDAMQLLQGVLTMTVQAAVAPVGRIAMILFYYDIRIRKEGFDLEVLASALGGRS
jgi:hypothetical protein